MTPPPHSLAEPWWPEPVLKAAHLGAVAFKGDWPIAFLYFPDIVDVSPVPERLFGLPVCEVDVPLPYMAGGEDVPLYPIWPGGLTEARTSMVREWQLRYSESGDY